MRRIPRDVDDEDAMAWFAYEDAYRPTRREAELDALEDECQQHQPAAGKQGVRDA